MAKKSASRSVIFYKRLIAASLATVILVLAGLSIFLGVHLGAVKKELEQAQFDLNVKEMEQVAAEEAERLRNEIQPEREKPAGELSAPEILANHAIVAHALGTVDGYDGLNCLEGFLQHYEAGVRVFEADLRMTSDGYVVLRHDWIGGLQEGIDPTSIPTLAAFHSTPIYGMYTPLSFADLLKLMAQYPDICVITDTKLLDTEAVTLQFQSMVDEAHKMGMTYLFDRMVVQVYSPDHFEVVNGVYHFPHYIYTLYQEAFGQTEEAFRNKTVFCEENGIMGITMWAYWWDPVYADIAQWRNLKVFAHTVNDAAEALDLLNNGVSGVYTDWLNPEDIGWLNPSEIVWNNPEEYDGNNPEETERTEEQ